VALGVAVRHRTREDRAGEQPARGARGDLLLAGDLRVDNRAELGAALGIRDTADVPDSRFVLAAYERWGEAFLERVVGAFALAIVDRRRGGVLLARDHFGFQPLVVHERPGTLAFASNAPALTALEGVGRSLDLERIREVLALAYPSTRTVVEGVRSVPPATALWADASGVRRWTWWRPDPYAIEDPDFEEAHERRLREALDNAVAARLRSAGTVAAMTSGGLDSPSVAATAAQQLAPEPLPTYTAVPPAGWTGTEARNWDADESPLVRDLAKRHPNIRPTFVSVEPGGSLLASHERLWELGAGPMRNPCNAVWQHAIVERAAGDGATALLTGARGNFFFSADGPAWLAELVRNRRPLRFARELSAWTRRTGASRRRTLRNHVATPLMPLAVKRARRAARGRPDRLAAWLDGTALRPGATAGLDLPAHLPWLDESRRRDDRAHALRAPGVGAALADTGAAVEALWGVERRDPTGDRRVVEAAIAQPEWMRRRGGVTRAVARGAMAGRLPASIVTRTRRGEQLPDWLDHLTAARGEIAAEVEAIAEHGPSRELIDVERLRTLVADWPDRRQNANPRVAYDYRFALIRALLVSRYARWFEDRSRT
jgi:asparagine synthase (glutamine-hydrolysing)